MEKTGYFHSFLRSPLANILSTSFDIPWLFHPFALASGNPLNEVPVPSLEINKHRITRANR